MCIDHFMWVCKDLDEAIASFYQVTGVKAEKSGAHKGMGTHNALLSLGEKCYLEILSVDPAQDIQTKFTQRIQALEVPGLLTWAAQKDDLDDVQVMSCEAELVDIPAVAASRMTEAGDQLDWQLKFLGGTELGFPFLIDWLDSPHPALTSPKGCDMGVFTIFSPDAEKLMADFKRLELTTDSERLLFVENSDVKFELQISTPKGKKILNSADPLFSLI